MKRDEPVSSLLLWFRQWHKQATLNGEKNSSITSITSARREKESDFELFHGECAHIDEEIPADSIFNLKIAIFFCMKSIKYFNTNTTTKIVAIPRDQE